MRGSKLFRVRNSLQKFFKDAVDKIEELSFEMLDSFFSIVPQMALPKVAIGSLC